MDPRDLSLSPPSLNIDLPSLFSVTPADQPEFRFASLFEQDSSRPENPLHVDDSDSVVANVDPTTDPEWLAYSIARSFEAMRKGSDKKKEVASDFECNVCYEVAKDPVVTSCGHLFCWPCLYRRFHVDDRKIFQECPVCVERVKSIVPIYGRGSTSEGEEEEEEKSEELKVPPRPRGKRVESQRRQQQLMYPRSAAQMIFLVGERLVIRDLHSISDEPAGNNASGDNRRDSELLLRSLATIARTGGSSSGTGPVPRSDEPVANNASGDNRRDSELLLRRLATIARTGGSSLGTGPVPRSDEPVGNNASGDNRRDSELLLRRLAMIARTEASRSSTGPGTGDVERNAGDVERNADADDVSDGPDRRASSTTSSTADVTDRSVRRRLE